MKTLRRIAGLPFVAIGSALAWIGLLIVRLGYVIGGGPYEGKFDPLDLFDESVRHESGGK